MNLQLNETAVVLNSVDGNEAEFQLLTGSAIVLTLLVSALSPGGSVTLSVQNTISADDPFEEIASIARAATGRSKTVLNDLHNRLKIVATVVGTATFKVGVSVVGETDASLGASMVTERHDRIDVSYPSGAAEVYTYKLAGVTVATVTVTYTDSTKANLSSVVKS
jgi:hypothetical protein